MDAAAAAVVAGVVGRRGVARQVEVQRQQQPQQQVVRAPLVRVVQRLQQRELRVALEPAVDADPGGGGGGRGRKRRGREGEEGGGQVMGDVGDTSRQSNGGENEGPSGQAIGLRSSFIEQ